MRKIVLLTNILSPYRKAFYQAMYEQGKAYDIDFRVLLMNDTESDRQWRYEDYCGDYSILLKKKVLFGKVDSLYINTDLIEKLNQLQPEILVLSGSYTYLPVWQALRWSKKNRNCRLLFWSESHLDEMRDYHRIKYMIRDLVRKMFYSRMEGFWHPGQKAKDLIQKYAKKDAFYIQVPNLIENQMFQELAEQCVGKTADIRNKYHLSTSKKLFFAPMRLSKVKGILPFLEMICGLPIEYKKKVQFAIAGEGELQDEIGQYIDEHHLDVVLLGYRSNTEVGELMCASDVVFLSSLSDPNPLTCIEALWCKKPLYVSRHVGNAPEVIKSGENGYVFAYEDQVDALQKLENLVDADAGWYQHAAEVSETIANEQFDVVKNTDRILKTLTEL